MISLTTLLKQGFMYPGRYLKGRTQKIMTKLEQIKQGEGAIVELNGQKVAVYKDASGKTIMLSPVCKHLGCIVGWNQPEKTWDCPCHGSRFSVEGKVIRGPAKKDLDRK